MGSVLDHQLFRIGQTSVTVASLGAALVLFAASWILSRLTHRLIVHRLLARSRLSLGLRHAIGRVAAYVVFFLGAVVGLQTIGINAGTLAAFGAAVGVGIGFGLQDIVKNFVSGLILLLERTVQVGDRIEVDGKAGDVVEIRGRATVVRTNDDVYLIVPNSRLIAETVVNHSFRRERERCRIAVGVAYGSEPLRVEEALLAAAVGVEGILEDPPPSVRFRAFGESTLEFELLCWMDHVLHGPGAVRSRLHHRIYEELAARHIEIPFPQRVVHLKSSGAEGAAAFAAGTPEGEERDPAIPE